MPISISPPRVPNYVKMKSKSETIKEQFCLNKFQHLDLPKKYHYVNTCADLELNRDGMYSCLTILYFAADLSG